MKASSDRRPLEISDDLSEERMIAAIRTLVSAVGGLRRLRGQLADSNTVPPFATRTDGAQLKKLSHVVTTLEGMAQEQREERDRLLQVRLREEIIEAYQPYIVDIWEKGRKPILPKGFMGDGFFEGLDGASIEERVSMRIRQAWGTYTWLRGQVTACPDDRVDFLASRRFVGDSRNKGIVATAQRAAAILLSRGEDWQIDDRDDRETSGGRAIQQIAASAHYDVDHHGGEGADSESEHTTLLVDAPPFGERGYFFGAGWSVDGAVATVADDAVGHLLDVEFRAAKAARALPEPYRRRPHELAQMLLDRIVVVVSYFDEQNPKWLASILGDIVARLDEEGWPADKLGNRVPPAYRGRTIGELSQAQAVVDAPPTASAMATGDVR